MSGKGSNTPSDTKLTKLGGPWYPLQKPLDRTIDYARDLYANQQNLPNITSQQQTGYNQAFNLAGQGGAPLQGAYQNVGNIAQNGFTNPVDGQQQQILDWAMNGSGGVEALQGTAGGQYLNNNPYVDQLVQQGQQDALKTLVPAMESRAAMAGRTGENNYMASRDAQVAGQLASQALQTRAGIYNQERGLQQQAQMALPGALATEVGTGLSATGQISGDAYRSLQAQLQAAGQLPQSYSGQFLPADAYLNYGNQQQQANEQTPWNRLQQLIGAYNQIGSGTNPAAAAQALSQQQPNQLGSTLVGLGSAAAGVLGTIYGGGPATGAAAAAAVNGLGNAAIGTGQDQSQGYIANRYGASR